MPKRESSKRSPRIRTGKNKSASYPGLHQSQARYCKQPLQERKNPYKFLQQLRRLLGHECAHIVIWRTLIGNAFAAGKATMEEHPALAGARFQSCWLHECAARRETVPRAVAVHVLGEEAVWAVVPVAASLKRGHGTATVLTGERLLASDERHTLKRKCSTSPSRTTYVLPSVRSFPVSRAFASPPQAMKSSYAMVSARMKPFSKSV